MPGPGSFSTPVLTGLGMFSLLDMREELWVEIGPGSMVNSGLHSFFFFFFFRKIGMCYF